MQGGFVKSNVFMLIGLGVYGIFNLSQFGLKVLILTIDIPNLAIQVLNFVF